MYAVSYKCSAVDVVLLGLQCIYFTHKALMISSAAVYHGYLSVRLGAYTVATSVSVLIPINFGLLACSD